MQERGQRFYTPSAGRWVNRDPLCDPSFFSRYSQGRSPRVRRSLHEQQFFPPYLFVGNSPVGYVDELGLRYGNPVTGPSGPVGPGAPSEPGGPYNPAPPAQGQQSGVGYCCLVSLWWHQGEIERRARNDAVASGVLGPNQGPQDAIRHCAGGCHLARFLQDSRACRGESIDEILRERERRSGDTSPDMDIDNGTVGAQAPAGTPCLDFCMQAFREGRLRVDPNWPSLPGNVPVPGPDDRL